MNTEIKSTIREITPDIAKDMLKRNNKNRKCRDNHVAFLKGQMLNGSWMFDGQPLRFSDGGILLDGQHRLTAIVESGTTQRFLVLTGIHSDAFKVMDTGKARSGIDAFHMAGHEYATTLAASCKLVINLNEGKNSGAGYTSVTNSQLLEWYDNNLDLINHVKKSQLLSKSFSHVLSMSWISAFSYKFSKTNVTDSETFINKLCNGLDLHAKSPIYILRKRLMEDKMNTARLTSENKKALIIKAWNLYRKGSECKFIRWNRDNEPFPIAI